MKDERNTIYSAAVFLFFALCLYAGSFLIQPTASDILGSRFFPQMVAVFIALLSIIQMAGGISAVKKVRKNDENKEENQEKKTWNKPLVVTTVALFAYYFLVLQIGFTITSILYLLAEGSILMSKEEIKDKKKIAVLVLVAVIVPVFLNTVFWNVFNIALPSGKWF